HDLGDLLPRELELLSDVGPRVLPDAAEKSAVARTLVHGARLYPSAHRASVEHEICQTDDLEGEVPTMPARRKTVTRRKTSATKKWVYLFATGKAEGNAGMRALLGGKGAGLAEMTNAGLPVPPGFTITTEACNAYFASDKRLPSGLWDQVERSLASVEKAAGKKLGDAK